MVEPPAVTLSPPAPLPSATALPLTLVGWNVESGGALRNVVAERRLLHRHGQLLHHTGNAIRQRQAQALNAWVGAQTLPLIALGNYSFEPTVTHSPIAVPMAATTAASNCA